MNNLNSRLPAGGLFLLLIALGMLLYELNTESYVRSLCLALVAVNVINLLVYPFNQTLHMLRKRSELNQWQKRWLSWQLVSLLTLTLLIDFII
jgi:hypothetical protein